MEKTAVPVIGREDIKGLMARSQKAEHKQKENHIWDEKKNGILNLLCLRSFRVISLSWAIVRQNGKRS